MGMFAEIVAIGPFSKEVVKSLEYQAFCYEQTERGAVLTEVLFGIAEGDTVSREFAALLGIANTWDFNQHKIKNSNINVEGLRKFVLIYKEYEEDLNKFLHLMNHGFEFHFRPNG